MKKTIKSILIKLGIFNFIKKVIGCIKKCTIFKMIEKIKYYKDRGCRNIKVYFFTNNNEEKLINKYVSFFNEIKPKNYKNGIFDYYLDTSSCILTKNRIIENMPLDYSNVVNNNLYNQKTINKKLINSIQNYANNCNIKKISLANNLEEALQIILFWNSLLWQTGHKLNGLGRLDKVLDRFPVPKNAKELIADFLLTLHTNYDYKSNSMLGDTGQIIILGGLDEKNEYFHNEYTVLFIECLKELKLPDPKILLRCSKKMPIDLLEKAVECVSFGLGSPLFSNDDIVIEKLIDFGYERIDACNYGVSACWEPLSIGNSLEQNNLADIEYGKNMYECILDKKFCDATDLNDIIKIYKEKLKNNCIRIIRNLNMLEWQFDPILSMLMGLNEDISKGSTKYNNYGILSVGVSSAINSLLNIQKFVFEKKEYSLYDVREMIMSNNVEKFSVNEKGFGTDYNEPIELTNMLIRETEINFMNYRNKFGGKIKFGLSSPSYISSAINVGATLDGRKAGEPFQTHISRDKGEPITEIINFESKLKFSGISCNANVLDIVIQKSLIKDNINKFTNLIYGAIKQGFFQMQINVLSYQQLVDAKAHPEQYPDLIVRVWGFSSYFNDLSEEYKNHLIKRTKEMEQL